MKLQYLKRFNESNQVDTKAIEALLQANFRKNPGMRKIPAFEPGDYEIKPDGEVNMFVPIYLWTDKEFTRMPIKFGTATDKFTLMGDSITTLEGCPEYVNEFICNHSSIKTLEGGPLNNSHYNKPIKGYSLQGNSLLESLKGSPEEVDVLICDVSSIKNLEGGPKKVRYMSLENNYKLESLEGGPEFLDGLGLNNCPNLYTTGGWVPKEPCAGLRTNIYADGLDIAGYSQFAKHKFETPILNIIPLFKSTLDFLESVRDFNYIKGKSINKKLLRDALIDYESIDKETLLDDLSIYKYDLK